MHVYLDNEATTKVLPEVIEAMIPYYSEFYGNPSSFHGFARDAHKGLDDARRRPRHEIREPAAQDEH